MRFVKLVALAVVSMVALAGCYTTTYVTGDAAAGTATDVKNHHVVNGLVTLSDPVALETICPGGASEITHQHTFVDGLIGYLTNFGVQIYKPTTFMITCSSGGGAKKFEKEDNKNMERPTGAEEE